MVFPSLIITTFAANNKCSNLHMNYKCSRPPSCSNTLSFTFEKSCEAKHLPTIACRVKKNVLIDCDKKDEIYYGVFDLLEIEHLSRYKVYFPMTENSC